MAEPREFVCLNGNCKDIELDTDDTRMSQIRQRQKPIALSMFSGAGGMDRGVSEAGFEVIACIESDPFCCETLRHNASMSNSRARIMQADIRAIDPARLMNELGLEPGDLDLLFGGPPCQAFSQIGKRLSLLDERGLLIFEMARFARVFRPKAIFIEQVRGILNAPDKSGKRGGAFAKLLSELKNLGYVTKWKLVNAADYGVAQARQRVFIVGTPDPNGFEFPLPTHGPAGQTTLFHPLDPYITTGEALKGLGPPKQKEKDPPSNSHMDVTPAGDRERIHGVPEGECLVKQLDLPQSQRKNLSKKDTTKFRRMSRSEPALTLRCGEVFFHPTEDRYLTPREYMRLHGFPDGYVLKGPIRGRSGRVRHLDQHRQIANSVPPPVARAIAKAILEVL